MRKAETKVVPDAQVKVKLVSPSHYVLTSQCLDKGMGISLLEQTIKDIDKTIQESGGGCVVKMAPKDFTEHELQALMDQRAKESEEVSRDEEMSESAENLEFG